MITLLFAILYSSNIKTYAASNQPDSDMRAVLTEMDNQGGKPIETLSAGEARMQPTPADAAKSVLDRKSEYATTHLKEVRDIQVQGGEGKIPARLYVPFGDGPFPVVVYYHGGGFVLADNDSYDATPRALAESTKSVFVAVEYRRAPDFKFPAAHNDAFEAYKWIVNHAENFNDDSNRVAVAGEGAGANLAINTSIAARNAHFAMPKYQLLIYPVVSTKMNSPSYRENADAKPLNKPMMGWFFDNYIKSESDKKDPRLDLYRAQLHALPDTTIITAQIDPLRSEGHDLADAFEAAGVNVDYQNYKGVTHEFFGMAPVVEKARQAQWLATRNLKTALALPRKPSVENTENSVSN